MLVSLASARIAVVSCSSSLSSPDGFLRAAVMDLNAILICNFRSDVCKIDE